MSIMLDRPVLIDLVAYEEVEAAVDAAERELLELEARAAAACARAEHLEAQLRAEGVHPETAAWMVVKLRHFVHDLLCEAEEEANLLVAEARSAASVRMGSFEPPWLFGALAVRRGRDATLPAVSWSPNEPVVMPEPVVVPSPVVVHEPVVMPEPVVVLEPLVVAVMPEPIVVLDPLLAAVPVAAGAVGRTAFEIDLVTAVGEESGPDASAQDMDRAFWPEQPESTSFWRRRPKVTAATTLTVTAGIAIVAAVAVQFA